MLFTARSIFVNLFREKSGYVPQEPFCSKLQKLRPG